MFFVSDLPQFLKITIYVLMISVCMVISCILICLGRRLWYKCKDMRDVEVKLPPGIVLPLVSDKIYCEETFFSGLALCFI